MVTTRSSGTAAICLALVCLAGADALQARTPVWTDAPLPGGRAALLPLVGLPANLPRAVVLGELIETAQYRRDPHNAQLVAIAAHFAAPSRGGDEVIPVPLDLDFWRTRVLGRQVAERDLIGAILADRQAALFCYGLLGLDPGTLAFVGRNPTLVRELVSRSSGAFAAFGHVVRVRDDRLELPGGADAALVWEGLIGQHLSDPTRAIPALLDRDGGRLAYMVETAATVDPRHLALLLPAADTLGKRIDHARAVYRAFVEIDALRNLSDLAFQRVAYDLPDLIDMLPVTADGQLSGTDQYWHALIDDDNIPEKGPAAWTGLDAGDPPDTAWVLGRLSARAVTERMDLIDLMAFLGRLDRRFPSLTAAERVYLGHAFKRYPALLLTLERAGVGDLPVWMALADRARQIEDHYSADAAGDSTLALFQAPIALVDRARQVEAVDEATASSLLARLAALDVTDRAFGHAVAGWIESALLPAFGRGESVTEGDAEARLLEGLAGFTAPAEAGPLRLVRWEDYSYRVDPAAAEVARLAEVRTRQAGNSLDTALRLTDGASAIAAADPDRWALAETGLDQVRQALVPTDPAGDDRLGPLAGTDRLLEEVSSELTRSGRRPTAKRGSSLASRLAPSENALLAETLTSLVYALWLGDPDGQAFLGGNVARRHDFGRTAGTGAERARVRWAIPAESAGAGEPWHVRGSLLALDLGLARLALHRTSLDMPEGRPMLNTGDRSSLVASLVFFPRTGADDPGPARLTAWLDAGRRRLGQGPDAATLAGIVERLGLDPRREQALRWTAREDPAELPRLFLLSELVQVGRPAGAAPPPGWGPSQFASTGCLCAGLPDPPAPHRFIGRPGTGVLVARAYDLELTVLEQVAALGLPPQVARGVLASAFQDYLDRARPAYPDDWRTLSEEARETPPDRIADYVSALTAGGPLVPVASEGIESRSRP